MTNPGCGYHGAKPTGLSNKDRKTVVGEEEFEAMRENANSIPVTFFRLRTLALLALLYLTGKRVSEIVRLELSDFKTSGGMLSVTFTLSKKRKDTVLNKRATKAIPLTDPLTRPIIEYLNYLQGLIPQPRYFLPRTRALFGKGLIIEPDHGIGRGQLWNLIHALNCKAWPHLFRETAGAEIIKKDPTIIGVFKVKQRLDHEDIKTSMGYLERYATDVIDRELKPENP